MNYAQELQVKDIILHLYPECGNLSVNRIKKTTRSTVYEVTCLGIAPKIVSILENVSQTKAILEFSAYQKIYPDLKQKGVPVPEVLQISQNTKDLGAPYCVMTKLDGEQADIVLKRGIGQASRDEIIQKIADALYKIHQVEATNIGLIASGKTSIDNWWVYIKSLVKHYQQTENEFDLVQYVIKYISNTLPRLTDPVKLTLVHNDFALHNILVRQVSGHWEVSGIVDFEWSFYGDPDWDISNFYWYLRDSKYYSFNHIFNVFKLAYYRNYVSPPILILDKIKVYTLLRLLFLHSNYPNYFDKDDFEKVIGWKQSRVEAK